MVYNRLMHAIRMQMRVFGGIMSEKIWGKKAKLEAPGYIYQVTKQGKYKTLRISEDDYGILDIYHNLYKKPRTTILHEMIGAAAKCWVEKHVEQIEELTKRVEETADYERVAYALFLYNEKYGPLKDLVKKEQP